MIFCPKEPALLLEARLIFGQEYLKIMEEHPVEDGALGMTRAVDSRHGRSSKSRNGPIPLRKG